MKRHLLTTLLIMAVATVTSAGSLQRKAISLRTGNEIPFSDLVPTVCDINSDATGASATYRIENVILEPDSLYQGSYKCVIDEFTNSDITSAPAYPLRKDYIQLPFGCDSATVSVTNASFQELSYELAPAYPFCIGVKIPVFTKKHVPPITQCDFGTQSDIVSMEIIDHLDQTYAVITVNPCQYNSIDKRIRVYTNFEIRINYGAIDQSKIAQRNATKREFPSSYIAAMQKARIGIGGPLIPNYDSIYCPAIEQDDGPLYRYYLIITSNRLLEAADKFAAFKRKMGFIPHISSRANWTIEQVQDSINSYYNNIFRAQKWNLKTFNAIIIGGQSDVPAKHIVKKVLDSDTMIEELKDYYSDYQYSCLNGSQNSGYFLGRIPASTVDGAIHAIDKIANYTLNPPEDESFYSTAAHIAYFEGTYDELSPHVYGAEESRNSVLSIRPELNINRLYHAGHSSNPAFLINNSNQLVPVPEELLKPNYPWQIDKEDIATQLNEGCIYTLYRGHGQANCFESPHVTSADISEGAFQNETKLPIFLNFTCLSGDFRNPGSFAETLLTYPYGGAVGVIAATERTNTVANNHLSRALLHKWALHSKNQTFSDYYNTFWPCDLEFGNIFMHAFYQNKDLTPQSLPFLQSTYHLFGDPSMLVWSRPPQHYTENEVWCQPHYDNTSNKLKYIEVLINLTNDEACNVAIEDKDTHETTLAYGSNLIFPKFNPQYQTMTIYGINRVPLEVSAPEQALSVIDPNKMLSFLPNPASSTCLIGYHLTTGTEGILSISNISTGQSMGNILVKGHIGRFGLDVSNFPNGLYSVTLSPVNPFSDATPIIGRGKLIIHH